MLLEPLVVFVGMMLLANILVPRFRSLSQPNLERIGGNLVSELRTARTMAMHLGRPVQITTDSLRIRLPASVALQPETKHTGTLVFLPDGRSGGASFVLSDAHERAVLTVDWLTGAVRLNR